ncbi:hypothetical protein [Bowmanella denitrificans]|uniref:hypothetical protein n=1 Tax=Bowmanella denitrificans TaxID=366582 RepID=UPI000C9C4B3D|nr:hypothetical protein [Bowmanella denitrificans]
MRTLLLTPLLLLLGACQPQQQSAAAPPKLEDQGFYQQHLAVSPYLPANLDDAYIACPLTERHTSAHYKTAAQVNYAQTGWESRLAADWQFFGESTENGRLLVIDFNQSQDGLSYRYLANGHSQDQLYEPWSSSKVMAITAAISRARLGGVGADSLAGAYPVADLITSIHTYEPFGKADGNSNAIASYLVNVSSRDYITSLFQDKWLKLANPNVSLRGAYASEIFDPEVDYWQARDSQRQAVMPRISDNQQDPGYLAYRCENCGLTGNKPMTTLAQAEWLKRLASHQQEPLTRHPGLLEEDIQTLFYGLGHSDARFQYGGMLMGMSTLVGDAIAKQLSTGADAKNALDKATDGQWRIFQKIGWGPSGTRGQSEVVMLAHVCLPSYQGGRAFTLAAQAGVPGDHDWQVNDAALKLQRLLDMSMVKLLSR